MPTVIYRKVERSDIPAVARIRAVEWETQEYWLRRITAYLDGKLDSQRALKSRIGYVALEGDLIVGFITGHLTERHSCDGELEWINVIPERRGSGVAGELLRLLAARFVGQKALRVCVNTEPVNTVARRFYNRYGAGDLKPHWLVWNDIRGVLDRNSAARDETQGLSQ